MVRFSVVMMEVAVRMCVSTYTSTYLYVYALFLLATKRL